MAVLCQLLERHERAGTDRRLSVRPAQVFPTVEAGRSLTEVLTAAEDQGAVSLVPDRDAPHLIEKVVLKDAARLYAFTGRARPSDTVAEALGRLGRHGVRTEEGRMLVEALTVAWSRREKLVGLGVSDMDSALRLVSALDAVFTETHAELPIRTRSTRLLGDSKALERVMPQILAYLKLSGLLDPETPRDVALERLGLTKFAQPVLIAGPVFVAGADLTSWPYVGLAPDLIPSVSLTAPARTVLTIENLESFNRHVRDCRQPRDVVIYTGGFPSRAVVTLLRALLGERPRFRHWGDIDPGGVRIGRYLETALGAEVAPHLMTTDLALRFGQRPRAGQRVPRLPETSAFSSLAAYLREDDALWLEQEFVDPVSPGPECVTSPAQ